MTPSQHAKVLEALELGRAAYPWLSAESGVITEALSIMRAVQQATGERAEQPTPPTSAPAR